MLHWVLVFSWAACWSWPIQWVLGDSFPRSKVCGPGVHKTRSPGWLNFEWWCPVFVYLQYGPCFLSAFWYLEFWGVIWISGKFMHPWAGAWGWTHLHLLLSLRMSRVIPLLPVYFFMACTETTLLSRVSFPWAIAQHSWFGIDISGQVLGPSARVNLAKTSWISSPTNMGPIPCLEVTVTNQPALCNSPKEWKP